MTETLRKAKLVRLKRLPAGPNGEPRVGPDDNGEFDVQFNPTSLKITQQNNIDLGGATTETQRRQNPSTESATLSFDLEFDTAETGGPGEPDDVRTRTAIVRQFTSPSAEQPTEPPPLLRFEWGSFFFVGIVNQLTEDLDYFSAGGRPLRAKVAVTMKEVRLDLEAKLVGQPARTGTNATPPGQPNRASGAPGSDPPANPDSVARAQAGESLQQLLARVNADPATWRAAMAGLQSPLALPAGAQVQLAAGATVGLGPGVNAGFAAGASVGGAGALAGALGSGGAEASLRGDVVVGGGVVAGGGVAAGFMLAEGGGVAASARAVATAQAAASALAARAAFDVPDVPVRASVTVMGPGQPMPPPVDPRTQSFGRGIPLRPRIRITAT